MWTERNERTSYSRCTWRTSSSSSLSSTSSSTTACSPTVTCLFSTCSTRLSCDHNHFIALVWWIVQQEQVTVQRVILTLSDVQRRGFCIVTGGEDKLLWLWPRYQNSGGRKYDEVTLRRADIAFSVDGRNGEYGLAWLTVGETIIIIFIIITSSSSPTDISSVLLPHIHVNLSRWHWCRWRWPTRSGRSCRRRNGGTTWRMA